MILCLGTYAGTMYFFLTQFLPKKAKQNFLTKVMCKPEVTREPEVGPIFCSTKKVIESVLV